MDSLQDTDIAMLCLEDGDIDIDEETGIIVYIGFMIDISIRKAYSGGGKGHKNPPYTGIEGCLGTKCFENSCATIMVLEQDAGMRQLLEWMDGYSAIN